MRHATCRQAFFIADKIYYELLKSVCYSVSLNIIVVLNNYFLIRY